MEEITAQSLIDISVSVVSHLQIELVSHLLDDLERCCQGSRFELILTLNLDEVLPFSRDQYSFPIQIVRNAQPLGFGANHNQAFSLARGPFFCVMNPDIRLQDDPFIALLPCLDPSPVGVVAPRVVGVDGRVEDSARRFPSPFKILCKAFGRCKGSDYVIERALIYPDWVAGMFMLFSSAVFERLGGFDDRYFLYYEDVDICARLRLQQFDVVLCPSATVVHCAQRASHRSARYMRWHLQSMSRFFLSPVYWKRLLPFAL